MAYSAFVKVYLNYLNHYNYFSKDKIKILSELTKCKHTNPFFTPFFPNNDPVKSGTDQAESGPERPLPECCCPFRLQLHFYLKQLIVVAGPRGPVEETFKVAFCSFYGPQTMAPLLGLKCQLELDTAAL